MGGQVRVAVIGGGITGLTCARALADAGHAVTVFDKGRGVGGRLATRRTDDGLRFDHGAQVLPATEGHTAVEHGEWTFELHDVGVGDDLYRDAVSWSLLSP